MTKIKNIYLYLSLLMLVVLASCNREEATLDLPNPADAPPSPNIGAFNLEGPVNSTNLVIDANGSDLAITWEATEAVSGGTVTYEWLLDVASGDFSAPLATITSDNSGQDAQLTVSQVAVDQILIDNGLNPGDGIDTKWTVRATEGTNVRLANAAFALTLNRTDPFVIRLANFPDLGSENVFVAGQFDQVGLAPSQWQQPGTNADLQLQQDTDGSYFIEFNVPDGVTSFEFKFFRATTSSPDWGDGEGTFTIDGGCSGAGNRTFVVDPSNKDVSFNVERWEQDACPTDLSVFKVTVGAGEVPADRGVFLAGQFGAVTGGDWQQPGTNSVLQMRQQDATTYYLALQMPAGSIEYKYFVASTSAPNWGNGAADASCGGTGNLSVTIVPGTTITDDNVPRFEGVGSCE